jgi:hypothetical protein
MKTQKPQVKLENWAVVPERRTGEYQELQPGNALVGKAFGHPRIQEGTVVFTSPILSFNSETKIVETKNTSYCLGEVSQDYKLWVTRRAAA